jgi:hypothetical protein
MFGRPRRLDDAVDLRGKLRGRRGNLDLADDLASRVHQEYGGNSAYSVLLGHGQYVFFINVEFERDNLSRCLDHPFVGIDNAIQLFTGASPLGVEIRHYQLVALLRGCLRGRKVGLPVDTPRCLRNGAGQKD